MKRIFSVAIPLPEICIKVLVRSRRSIILVRCVISASGWDSKILKRDSFHKQQIQWLQTPCTDSSKLIWEDIANMTRSSLMVTCTLLVLAVLAATADAQLSDSFYNSTCPSGAAKVAEVVRSWVSRDRTLAPALLRLHFHDCFVRGCEGSVLLDAANGEKVAAGNINSLRGFEVIDDAKAQLETLCPNTVSCSDILSLAARDAMVQFSGSALNWAVPLGRRDGVSSLASEANSQLPPPFASFPTLVSMFSAKGFSSREMVVVSGSHTVGRAHCRNFQSRLYNFSSTAPTDPSLDASFAASLKRQCAFGDTTTLVKMDQSKSVDSWDQNYYSNVLRGRVLFQSDDALKRTTEGNKIVQNLNRVGSSFTAEFAAAMTKMSKVGVLTGSSGQIRKKCNLVN